MPRILISSIDKLELMCKWGRHSTHMEFIILSSSMLIILSDDDDDDDDDEAGWLAGWL